MQRLQDAQRPKQVQSFTNRECPVSLKIPTFFEVARGRQHHFLEILFFVSFWPFSEPIFKRDERVQKSAPIVISWVMWH
jgi:hypothetical protein